MENGKVPLVVERLITTIEMYGLYTEGIYRKSGVSNFILYFNLAFVRKFYVLIIPNLNSP